MTRAAAVEDQLAFGGILRRRGRCAGGDGDRNCEK
jgi:hypothetical protein